jgi:uncharacterized repeat protein (TIGR01451 family)
MRRRFPRWLAAVGLAGAILVVGAGVALGTDGDDTPTLQPGAAPITKEDEGEELLLARDNAFITRRLAGDIPLDNQQAGALRAAAARTAARLRKQGTPTAGPTTFPGVAWQGIGPNPIVQVLRSGGPFAAMSGRIGALAIRPSNGQIILGAATGGIWLWDSAANVWLPKTGPAGSANIPSLAIGALAIAPTNDAIVYAGTGEGHLSGDSYFGNGVLKSTDGGNTWTHVSGDYFEGVAISRIVVDPTNASHLYAAVLRGRGGRERTSPTVHSKFGLWESKNGGADWTLLKEAQDQNNPACTSPSCGVGATDLEIDPQNAQILYSSFWGDAIYKSTNGGASWSPIMNFGFSSPDFAGGLTRFSISLSHPAGQGSVLYAGFDWSDANGHHPSRVFKSTNQGATWSMLPAGSGADTVEDYCGGQCFYDNVIEAAPDDPNIVFAGGQFNYGIGSGGLFRSDDGGTTWKNLGYAQHPDFQALAFEPDNTQNVVEGSDGGVWYSNDRGGRPNAADPLSAVTWQNLNGTVNPANAAVLARTNLQISQLTSVATVPQFPPTSALSGRFWGGTQDNGTLRKSTGAVQWFDVAGGDGGQVLVDPTPDPPSATCPAGFAPSCFIYGTFNGISPYRFDDGGANFFGNKAITGGINTGDRSDFYIPFVMNKENTNQLFLGTYRLYRTDNARTLVAGDVHWDPISPDLTSGCTGPAPNGGRACVISAIGVGGGQAVYTGSIDGRVYMSADAQVNLSPSWTREDLGELPNRPVTQFAVDRSNYRIAYAAYAGFNAATPSRPGHLFKTSDGGQNWDDISGNLPDSPVNSVILDPSYANTLYVGTDVGTFVTYNGGVNWSPLGTSTSMPIVPIWQLDFDSSNRVLAAGTHGRGAFRLQDTTTSPALVLSKVDASVPVGPASSLEYTLTLRNEGNATANNVVLTDPVPANTSFVSASDSGAVSNGKVTWPAVSILAGGSITRTFTVSIANALKNKVKSIVNDGFRADASGGFFTTGSPFVTPIASAYGVTLSPASQTGGAHTGSSASYHVTVRNAGFTTDSFTMSSTGGTFAVSFFQSDCTTALTTVGPLAPGATSDVCVQVAVPGGAANGSTNTSTVTATSVGDPSVSGSATITTIAVTVDTLLVDEDGNAPDVQSYYSTALTSAGVSFNTWDLSTNTNLPVGYMAAFKNIVWFTGTSYPGPLLPYEARLKTFLDGGGRLFLSGYDLLDQSAGTTPFVLNYLHVTWDGTETQNDKATANIHEVASTLTAGLGTVPLNVLSGYAHFEDQITPNGTAVGIFTDDSAAFDGLSFDGGAGSYKVVFLAFPFEEYGSATDKSGLAGRIFTFFGP